MKIAARIVRLEREADRLLGRIRRAQLLYNSERLLLAGDAVQLARRDLRLAKTYASVRPRED